MMSDLGRLPLQWSPRHAVIEPVEKHARAITAFKATGAASVDQAVPGAVKQHENAEIDFEGVVALVAAGFDLNTGLAHRPDCLHRTRPDALDLPPHGRIVV